MLVLGIESTCDEAGCAIVRDGYEILSNTVSSQIDLHKEYGGVVPELACRRHIDVFIPVLDQALHEANVTLEQIDLIAVANQPGLVGALLIGLNAAKALSLALNKPLIGINHIEAHLYAALMSSHTPAASLPALGVVLSGGHTSIFEMRSLGDYIGLGQTVDDAIGEAFDKVAKMLGYDYPGGPIIEKLARQGDAQRYPLKAGRVKNRPLDFSFSGLKTAVLYTLKGQNLTHSASAPPFDTKTQQDIAASFQMAAFLDVIQKAKLAAEQTGLSTLFLGGGVTNSQTLRALFVQEAPHLTCIWPPAGLSLDNAAMIAGLGYHRFNLFGADNLELEALPRSLS